MFCCTHSTSRLHLLVCVCIYLVHVHGEATKNLLKNPDFEDEISGEWFCESSKCAFERTSTTSYKGKHSAKVYNRSDGSAGLQQTVSKGIRPMTRYYLSGRIKMDNQVGRYHTLEAWATLTGASAQKLQIGIIKFMRLCDGWVLIGGDFMTKEDTQTVTVSVYVSETGEVRYYLDTMALEELKADPLWRQKADARIDTLRKADITMNIEVKQPYQAKDITLLVNQTSQAFPFGVSVNAEWMYNTDPLARKYQHYVWDMFNWVTFGNDAKWTSMEKTEGQPYFGTLDAAFPALAQMNLTQVRGHTITWARDNKDPPWLQGKSPKDIMDSVKRRVGYLADRYKNKFAHWDVNNEKMHGNWYADNTNNQRFTQDLFQLMYSKNKHAQLFLNDFFAVMMGSFTTSLTRMGRTFLEQGVPIRGIGTQSHITAAANVDVHLFKHRLDILSTAGLPIWITEFDLRDRDTAARANATEDALRLYYSHPSVAGIFLWIFWDGKAQFADACLINGNDFVENEVGIRVRGMYKREWSTNEAKPLTHFNSQTQTVRAFYGTHNLQVLHQGLSIGSHQLELTKDKKLEINITIDKNGIHVTPVE